MRLFVSIPCPAETAARWHAALEPWMAAMPAARWSPADQYHITLKFLGETERLADAERCAGQAAQGLAAFPITAGGLGVFPSATRARVLWLGIKEGAEALMGAAAAVDRAFAAAGFTPEPRDYSPHLTLARLEGAPLPALPPPPDLRWQADKVCLMESLGGAKHARRAAWALGPPP